MKRFASLPLVTLALAFGFASAEAQADAAKSVEDGGIHIPGWMVKIDAREAAAGGVLENARLAMEDGALHILTGPATTYWNPANVASGDYRTAALLATPTPGAGQAAADLFDFRSGFWMNLHHFLYVTARAANGEADAAREAVAGAAADTAGYGTLPASARGGWERAVRFYRDWPGRLDILFDSAMTSHKHALRALPDAADPSGAAVPPELASALAEARPAYRARWWPSHDAANRAWLDEVRPLLDRWGADVARYVAAAYDTTWSGAVPVDIVAWANWAGAYTSNDPTHVTVSSLGSRDGPAYALETLFHEALHGFDVKMTDALIAEARAQRKWISNQLWHTVLFYTAGAGVRSVLPDHVPYGEHSGLFRRGENPLALPLVEAHWAPHLRGEYDMAEAIRRMVAAHP